MFSVCPNHSALQDKDFFCFVLFFHCEYADCGPDEDRDGTAGDETVKQPKKKRPPKRTVEQNLSNINSAESERKCEVWQCGIFVRLENLWCAAICLIALEEPRNKIFYFIFIVFLSFSVECVNVQNQSDLFGGCGNSG